MAGAKAIGGRRGYWIKYLVFGLWFTALITAAVRGGGFQRLEFTFALTGGPPRSFLFRYGELLILLPLAFLIGRWASCHYICWIAPLMIFGTRIKERAGWPSLRLKADSEKCAQCEECIEACPMSLPVRDMVGAGKLRDDECVLCGSCVSSCPSGAIRFAFTRPGKS